MISPLPRLLHLLLAAALLQAASATAAPARMSACDALRLQQMQGISSRSQEPASRQATLYVELRPGCSVDALAPLGAVPVMHAVGSTWMVWADTSRLDELRAHPAVASLAPCRGASACMDLARADCNVDRVRDGSVLAQPYTGKGVLIGFIDQGFDFAHINFLDSEGRTRILHAWKYDAEAALWHEAATPAEIMAFGTDADISPHGTHTAGIAAGSYANAEADYSGVAPGASLALCGSATLPDEFIYPGVQRLIDLSRREGMPLVVNMSLGTTAGPHDLSQPDVALLESLASQTVVSISAGNDGYRRRSLVATATDEVRQVNAALQWPSYVPLYGSDYQDDDPQREAYWEIWGSDSSPFDIALDLYIYGQYDAPLLTLTPEQLRQGVTISDLTNPVMAGIFGRGLTLTACTDTESPRYNACIFISGSWGVEAGHTVWVARCSGLEPGQRVDMFVNSDRLHSSFISNPRIEGVPITPATGDMSISSLAAAPSTIVVGAYSTTPDNYWDIAPGHIFTFSSWGTLPDGREMPHLTGPGCVVSSTSRYYTLEPPCWTATVDGTEYGWLQMAGTSMSTPFVSGTFALWLEANPWLTASELRDIAMRTARRPEGFEPTVQWGAGAIDALAGIREAIRMSGLGDVEEPGRVPGVMVERRAGSLEIFLGGHRGLTATLVAPDGRVVATAASGQADTAVVPVPSQPGVYVLHVASPTLASTVKVRL